MEVTQMWPSPAPTHKVCSYTLLCPLLFRLCSKFMVHQNMRQKMMPEADGHKISTPTEYCLHFAELLI